VGFEPTISAGEQPQKVYEHNMKINQEFESGFDDESFWMTQYGYTHYGLC
jgi:hypothetical protein